jgi:arsenate reductase
MESRAMTAHTLPYQALFLCTGNSARSILAEALLAREGRGRFVAHSAGSHPTGAVHPMALELLRGEGLATAGLRSKSWDEFARPEAPALDFVITVCDAAAGEACPFWPGQPMTGHWGVPDPAAATGSASDQKLAFRRVYATLERRVRLFAALPFETLDGPALQREVAEIGRKD